MDVHLRICRYFSMEEIKQATQNFAVHLILSDGGFRTVYEGVIDGETEVAIKRRRPSSERNEQVPN